MTMLEIRSAQGSYPVAECPELRSALAACAEPGTFTLIDRRVHELYAAEAAGLLVPERTLAIEASEEAKSLDALAPVFTWLVESGLKRNGHLVVVGGG
ncbi:MAG: 3-dehydroquinate synthase, partial [Gemmatimonadetes bacterium]|nr:3-dehydroquinate synthase [Gemmatimonadota bacterium]